MQYLARMDTSSLAAASWAFSLSILPTRWDRMKVRQFLGGERIEVGIGTRTRMRIGTSNYLVRTDSVWSLAARGLAARSSR